MEDWEVEENNNIDVVKEIDYLQSSKNVEAEVNVLDEIPQSYSQQGNLKLDQTRYTIENKIMNLWIWQ
jgi:hypothetical protein